MIDTQQAKAIAREYLNTLTLSIRIELIAVEPIAKNYGWIFSWNSRKALEGDFTDSAHIIAGNIPFLVDLSGDIHNSGLGSAFGLEQHIEAFDKKFTTA
jgi:hypothetical protein